MSLLSHLEDLDSSDVHPSTQSYGVGKLSSDVDKSNSLSEIENRLPSPTTSSEIYPSAHVDDSFQDNNGRSSKSHLDLYASTIIYVFSSEFPISDRPRSVLATSFHEMNEEMGSRFTRTQEYSSPARESSADWKSVSASINDLDLSSLDSGVTASTKEIEFQSVTIEYSEGYSTLIESSVIEKNTPRLTSQVTRKTSSDVQVESTENYSSATTLTSAIRHEATLMPIVETQLPNSINSPLISDKPYFLIDSSAADEIHFMSLGTEQSMLGSRFVATTYMIDAVSDSNALTLPAIFLSLSIDSDVSSSTYEGKSSSALLLESSDSSYRDILELPSILNEMSTHVFNIFSSSFSTESVSKPEKSVVVSATVTESPPLSISPNIQTTETTTITPTAQRTSLLPYTGTSIDVTTRFPHYSHSSSRVTDTATFPSLFTQFSTLLTGTTPPLQTTLPIGGTTVPLGTTPWPVVPNTTVSQQFSNARSMLQHSALLALQTTASHLSKELETVSSTPGPGLSATVRGEVNTVSNSFLANIFSDENFNGFLPAESTSLKKLKTFQKYL